MSAYGFSEDAARRIASAVRKVEGDVTTPTAIGPRFTGSQMSVVKVTSVSSPLSFGIRLDYNATDSVLEVRNNVRIREVNNQALKVNNYYVGFFSGYTAAGDPVFLVSVSGSSSSGSSSSGSASGSSGDCFDVIQSISCDNGELEVTYATICPDSGTAIIVGQQTGNYAITTRYSITGGASLSSGVILNLVGDVASPESRTFYGTNSSGTRGWYQVEFTSLENVPNSFTGNAGKFLVVNSGETALEFGTIDLTSIEGDISDLQDDISTAQGDISSLQGTVSGHTTLIGNLETTVSGHTTDITELQTRLNTAESALSTAEGAISTLQSDLSTAQGNISSLQSDLSTAQGIISSLSSSVSSLESRVSALESA